MNRSHISHRFLPAAVFVAAAVAFAGSVEAVEDVFFFDTPPAARAAKPRREGAQRAAAAPAVVQARAIGMNPVAQLVAAAPDGDAQEAVFQQLMSTYRQSLQVELSFANRVCRFDEAQRDKVVRSSVEALEKLARAQAKKHPNPQNGGVFMQVGGAVVAMPQSEALDAKLRLLVSAAVNEFGAPQQVEDYRRELKAREEFQRDAVVDGLVSVLDERLHLKPPQAKKIAASLQAKWSEKWAGQLMQLTHNREYFPAMIPAACITPHLDAEQKQQWQRMPKVTFGGGGLQQLRGMLNGAVGLVDDVPAEVAP